VPTAELPLNATAFASTTVTALRPEFETVRLPKSLPGFDRSRAKAPALKVPAPTVRAVPGCWTIPRAVTFRLPRFSAGRTIDALSNVTVRSVTVPGNVRPVNLD